MWIFSLLFIFFNGLTGGFYTDLLFPSRAMMPFLPAYPETKFAFLEAYITVCWVRDAGSRGKPGRGKGWDGETGVLGVKLVIVNLWRFSGAGLFGMSGQLLIV